jgi:multidrug efflux pump subunit AcrA (membrane-fusion protein)
MTTDAIPSPIQSLLDLFTTALADVRFADVDGQTLARVAADVEAAIAVVSSAEAALASAREALQERQEALLQQAQRALAYARVYAESDEALTERLGAIALPRGTRKGRATGDTLILSPDPEPAPRPRGRPRKQNASEPLPAAPPPVGE